MSIKSHISLIDLSEQLPFNIDDIIKKQICFGESLIISCGHVEGNFDEILSDSECSRSESFNSEKLESTEDNKAFEVTKQIEEKVAEDPSEDSDNFRFYFFSDCTHPVQEGNSKSSVIIKDGMPQINHQKLHQKFCSCEVDKHGQCQCHIKIPCWCGGKEKSDCECSELKSLCICHDGKPNPKCTCSDTKVCMCYPDGKPRVECTCDQINKPCVCHKNKFPSPHCICEDKSEFISENRTLKDGEMKRENQIEERSFTEEASIIAHKPCECQNQEIPESKRIQNPDCLCLDGKKCTCNEDVCVCRANESLKLTCSCSNPRKNSSNSNLDATCECFLRNKICTCGNLENCKCFYICQCTDPCVCDTNSEKINECTCYTPSNEDFSRYIGDKKEIRKLKKVRAGKHGFRWCHDVNPRHTYFGYGYGRHEKINNKEKESENKKNYISGINTEKNVVVTNVEKLNIPIYQKKGAKLSLDCCSAVGGLTIHVETLGEDKDKFLIQVVSHSSKEGAKTGSKIVSIIDCNLHTMEENRSEYIEKKDKFKEKRNYMAICESGYYNKVTRICGDRHLIKRFYHTFEEAHNFLLEGANIILMRYVGLTRYKGCIKTDTVLIDGVVCESIYVCLGVKEAIVNGQPLFVEKVERHIIEPSGCIHQSLMVLTLKGYLVSQEWADCSYILHINPLLRVFAETDEIELHEPLRETWRTDLQLLSDYLDFKSVRSSEGARYVSENGELTGTIRDYLQAVLLLRPSDTLHFTRHYFGAALSALDLPHNEYFDCSTKHVRYFFFEE